jgi:hypothetical protein
MQVTVTIHESWLRHPDSLRQMIAVLDGLEQPAPAPREPGEDDDDAYPPDRYDDPEASAPAPARRAPGKSESRDRDQTQDPDDKDAPRDGRQLLGWASKQVPDLKGVLIGYGKKRGLHSKIVEWSPQEVADAYRFARRQQATTR